jgi:hypothetical protein
LTPVREHRGQTFNINFVRRPDALHYRDLRRQRKRDEADRNDGDIVNQIVYAYDGWGNVATSWQAHDGKVDNDGLDGDDSPSVQYGYDSLARLTSVTYPTDPPGAPTNRVVGYSYGGRLQLRRRPNCLSYLSSTASKLASPFRAWSYFARNSGSGMCGS